MTAPLPVAIAAVIHGSSILLIKRSKNPYKGFWALPGGKLEEHEHISDAAVREVFEETGISSIFQDQIGFVSEHLMEKNQIVNHFLLHICCLKPQNSNLRSNAQEGEVAWFSLHSLAASKEQIIPSDYLIIEQIVKKKQKNYYNCVIVQENGTYTISKFE